MVSQNPARDSSTELSTISYTRWCSPRDEVLPIYIPGLLRTASSPHRDDLAFMLGEIDIRTFGSQGQQRTAALSP